MTAAIARNNVLIEIVNRGGTLIFKGIVNLTGFDREMSAFTYSNGVWSYFPDCIVIDDREPIRLTATKDYTSTWCVD